MAATFADLSEAAGRHGVTAVGLLWMKETVGLLRFAVRERWRRLVAHLPDSPRGGPSFGAELRWAWRGVRARGWRAVLIVGLLALALAVNTLVFSVADALVFHRVTYPNADRLVQIEETRDGHDEPFLSPSVLDAWGRQTDLFADVQGFIEKGGLFLLGGGSAERVNAADVTPGLFPMLGVRPQWGRPFATDDAFATGAIPTILSAGLAASRFGSPARAVGQQIETTADPLLVVGVMAQNFRFPDGSAKLWRVMDPRGPLTRGFGGVQSLALLARGLSRETATSAAAARAAALETAAGGAHSYVTSVVPFYVSVVGSGATVFLVLLGAAGCLLLTACATVASVELASAVARTRTYAIHLALGGSRAALARVALIEGALLVLPATALALILSVVSTSAVVALLPVHTSSMTAHVIGLDARAIAVMALAMAVTWLATTLPLVLYGTRPDLVDILKTEDRGAAAARRGSRVRQSLTAVEVGLAVMLLIGSVLYTRTYGAYLSLDRGFDSTNLAELDFTIPSQFYAGPGALRDFTDQALTTARRLPGVAGVTSAAAPPSIGDSPMEATVEIDDGPPMPDKVLIANSSVDPDYFRTLRLPIEAGRVFATAEPPTNAVITDQMARHFGAGWLPARRAGRIDLP